MENGRDNQVLMALWRLMNKESQNGALFEALYATE
jgi:hypothetical protein